MIPDREILYKDPQGLSKQPSLTYAIELEREDTGLYDEGRITGVCSGADAMKQAVYKILGTQFGAHCIYGDYGSEHLTLIGKPKPFVIPEAERMITEALMRDDRITGADGFEFEEGRGSVSVRFTVHTVFGDIEAPVVIKTN